MKANPDHLLGVEAFKDDLLNNSSIKMALMKPSSDLKKLSTTIDQMDEYGE